MNVTLSPMLRGAEVGAVVTLTVKCATGGTKLKVRAAVEQRRFPAVSQS